VKSSLEGTPRARDEMPMSTLCTGSEMMASAASANMTSMAEGPGRMDTPMAARCARMADGDDVGLRDSTEEEDGVVQVRGAASASGTGLQ
jgi:hypothetical protein